MVFPEATIATVDLYNPSQDPTVLDDARSNKVGMLAPFIIENPSLVVSLGCGGGQETQALAERYGSATNIVGLDNSPESLDRTRQRAIVETYSVQVLRAEAGAIPLADNSVDGLIASHLLHEVYAHEGRTGWSAALKEIARVTKPGGAYLIRDFAAPVMAGLSLVPRTAAAAAFLDYFPPHFIDTRGQSAPSHLTAETLLHFKTFMADIDRGITHIGDSEWSDLEETYLPPLADAELHTGLLPLAYAKEVIAVATTDLNEPDLRCVAITSLDRAETNQLLGKHFLVQEPTGQYDSMQLIDDCTRKMQMVFQKTER